MPIFSNAQTFPSINYYTTIYTRNGTSVEGIVYYPLSSQDYATSLNYIQQYYPNVTILEDPTSEYNCYSYAFHLSEGNTQKAWINSTTTTGAANLSKYWTDGSFIQVCNEADADKAYYYAGDHAAVTTSSISGEYESKWGANCRIIHAPNYCPYDVPYYRRYYYASTKVSGDASNLCTGTRTFSVKNISGATYTWTCSSTLSPVGASNTHQYVAQRNGSSNGDAWVQVAISTSCSSSSATTRQDFTVGTPNSLTGIYSTATNTLSLQTVNFVPVGNIYAQYQWPGISNITANLTSGSPSGTGFYSFPGHFNFNISSGQQVSVYLTGTGACGSVDATRTFIQSSYYYLVISPNPSSNNVNVGITEVVDTTGKMAKEQKLISNTSGITKMYLYDFNTGVLVKEWTFQEMKSGSYNLNIVGVKQGLYVLKMDRDNKTTSTKIIVK